jgi:hypothetical protein
VPVVTLVSAKGSPGVTTAAAALAAAATVEGPALFVELDPAGGDVRILTGAVDDSGVVGAAGELRRDVSAEAIGRHVSEAVPGLAVLLAPTAGMMATSVIGSVIDRWSAALHQYGGTVFVDAGRWDAGQPTARRVSIGDLVVIVCRPTVASVEHTRQTVDRLQDVARRPVVGLVVGTKPYAPAEVAAQLDIPVAGAVAWDPRGTSALWAKGVTKAWGRSWLAATAASTLEGVGRHVPVVEAPLRPRAAAAPAPVAPPPQPTPPPPAPPVPETPVPERGGDEQHGEAPRHRARDDGRRRRWGGGRRDEAVAAVEEHGAVPEVRRPRGRADAGRPEPRDEPSRDEVHGEAPRRRTRGDGRARPGAGVESGEHSPVPPGRSASAGDSVFAPPGAGPAGSGEYRTVPQPPPGPGAMPPPPGRAGQPSSGEHRAVEQPPSGEHRIVAPWPSAGQPSSGEHRAVEQPPSGEHRTVPPQPNAGQAVPGEQRPTEQRPMPPPPGGPGMPPPSGAFPPPLGPAGEIPSGEYQAVRPQAAPPSPAQPAQPEQPPPPPPPPGTVGGTPADPRDRLGGREQERSR